RRSRCRRRGRAGASRETLRRGRGSPGARAAPSLLWGPGSFRAGIGLSPHLHQEERDQEGQEGGNDGAGDEDRARFRAAEVKDGSSDQLRAGERGGERGEPGDRQEGAAPEIGSAQEAEPRELAELVVVPGDGRGEGGESGQGGQREEPVAGLREAGTG